jgi:hypothetical protein
MFLVLITKALYQSIQNTILISRHKSLVFNELCASSQSIQIKRFSDTYKRLVSNNLRGRVPVDSGLASDFSAKQDCQQSHSG